MGERKYFIEEYEFSEEQKDLIKKYIPMVYKIWSNLNNSDIKTIYKDDFISDGIVALCRAAKNWDKNISNFLSYSHNCVKKQMFRTYKNCLKISNNVSSLDDLIDQCEDDGAKFIDFLYDETNIEEDYINKEIVEELKELIELNCNEKEKRILRMHCYEVPQEKIAHVLGISRARVRQIFKRTCEKILKIYNLKYGEIYDEIN